jgi:hypothetical protein
MHRLHSRRGRWAYAGWYRTARQRMRDQGLERLVRGVLLPLYPRAAYFPDFLTPAQGVGDWDTGVEALLATPPRRVRQEIAMLDRTVGAPPWAAQPPGRRRARSSPGCCARTLGAQGPGRGGRLVEQRVPEHGRQFGVRFPGGP